MISPKEQLEHGVNIILRHYDSQGKTYQTTIKEDGTKRIYIDEQNEILIFPWTPSEHSIYFSNIEQVNKIYPEHEGIGISFNRKHVD